MFIEAKDDGGGGDNWTTGAIGCAKLKSNHHHQQTNIQFFENWNTNTYVRVKFHQVATITIIVPTQFFYTPYVLPSICPLLMYTGKIKSATKTYGQKLIRNQYSYRLKEGNGVHLETHCEEMTTALPNKLYSGQHKATEEDGKPEIPEEEIWSQKWNSRIQIQLQLNGGSGSKVV